MVKGVTRRIVEIKETGSSYFERAIFFVRMENSRNTNEYTLSQEARRIIDKFSGDVELSEADGKKRKKQKAMYALKLAVAAVAGALAAFLIMKTW